MINSHDFTLVWPLVPTSYQPRAYRILSDILPLLRIALRIPQKVIKEPSLPQGCGKLWWCSSRRPRRLGLQRHGNSSLQPTRPKPKTEVLAPAHKEVHMVRHDDIASHSNAVFSISA